MQADPNGSQHMLCWLRTAYRVGIDSFRPRVASLQASPVWAPQDRNLLGDWQAGAANLQHSCQGTGSSVLHGVKLMPTGWCRHGTYTKTCCSGAACKAPAADMTGMIRSWSFWS